MGAPLGPTPPNGLAGWFEGCVPHPAPSTNSGPRNDPLHPNSIPNLQGWEPRTSSAANTTRSDRHRVATTLDRGCRWEWVQKYCEWKALAPLDGRQASTRFLPLGPNRMPPRWFPPVPDRKPARSRQCPSSDRRTPLTELLRRSRHQTPDEHLPTATFADSGPCSKSPPTAMGLPQQKYRRPGKHPETPTRSRGRLGWRVAPRAATTLAAVSAARVDRPRCAMNHVAPSRIRFRGSKPARETTPPASQEILPPRDIPNRTRAQHRPSDGG